MEPLIGSYGQANFVCAAIDTWISPGRVARIGFLVAAGRCGSYGKARALATDVFDRPLVCGIDSFFGSTGTVQDLPDSIHRKPVCFNRIDRAFVWMWSVLCHPSNEKRIFVLPSFFDRKSVVGSRQSAK